MDCSQVLGEAATATDPREGRPENVLPILRQLLDIPEDKWASLDGVRIATEVGSPRLTIAGGPRKSCGRPRCSSRLDMPAPGAEAVSAADLTPQLETYPITSADPQTALAVLQTVLAGQPDVRLVIDGQTGGLIAMARVLRSTPLSAPCWNSCSSKGSRSRSPAADADRSANGDRGDRQAFLRRQDYAPGQSMPTPQPGN